ncbi:MAG TPA: hypothetical protein VGH54_21445 [Mycobacterium sp.]|jgi:hypothetical protein|uniref:hypothetical protein n=1 Tax=Mycobacterium sp. TaxID=1785 RepID=UPI002F3E8A4E
MKRALLTLEELTLSLGMAVDMHECTTVGVRAIEAGLASQLMTCDRCWPGKEITLQRLIGHVRALIDVTGTAVHTPDDFMQVTTVNERRR